MRKVFKYLAPYWWQIILVIIFTYANVWGSLQLPTLMSNIVNQGILNNDQAYIISTGLRMLLVAAVAATAAIVTGFLASRIATGFARKLRLATFEKIESFSLNEINKFSTASLITRSTNDIQQIQQVTFMVLRIAVQAPLMAVGAVFSALRTAPNMAWIMALAAGVLLILVTSLRAVDVPVM